MAGDPYWPYVVLLMGFEGPDGSTGAPGYSDESLKAHPTATNIGGGPTISTTQFKAGTSSLHTTGGNGITIPDSIDWCLAPGNNDCYTVEGFIYWSGIGTNVVIAAQANSLGAPSDLGWYLLTDASTGQHLRWVTYYDGTNSGVDITTSGHTFVTGQFYHFCAEKNAANKVRIYIDGVMRASVTGVTNGRIWNSAQALCIAQSGFFGATVNGYTDELRFTKGLARYDNDAGFTVPSTPFPRGYFSYGDPFFANTVLLLGFDDVNNSVTLPGMTDQSAAANGNAIVQAGAKVSTAQSKFGGSSLVLNGAGDYLNFNDNASWNFGTGAFTVEGFWRFVGAPTNACLFQHWPSDWALYFESGQLFFRALASAQDTTHYSFSPTLNQWYHIAMDRDASNVARVYVDGVMVSKNTGYNHNIGGGTNVLGIGSLRASFTGYDVNGYGDELRITKAARYASDSGFTVPTSPLPRGPLPTTVISSQIGGEAWTADPSIMRISQIGAEAWTSITPAPTYLFATQVGAEIWLTSTPPTSPVSPGFNMPMLGM